MPTTHFYRLISSVDKINTQLLCIYSLRLLIGRLTFADSWTGKPWPMVEGGRWELGTGNWELGTRRIAKLIAVTQTVVTADGVAKGCFGLNYLSKWRKVKKKTNLPQILIRSWNLKPLTKIIITYFVYAGFLEDRGG